MALSPWLPPAQFISFTGPGAHADLDPDSFELRVITRDRTEVTLGHGDRHVRCFGTQLQRFIACFEAGKRCTPGMHEALASLEYTGLLVASMNFS